MCNWDAYSYDCGHLKVQLRERCSKKRADDEQDPCYGIQVVRNEWRHHQNNRVCAECRLQEGRTGHGCSQVSMSADRWMAAAHRAAIEKNQSRGRS